MNFGNQVPNLQGRNQQQQFPSVEPRQNFGNPPHLVPSIGFHSTNIPSNPRLPPNAPLPSDGSFSSRHNSPIAIGSPTRVPTTAIQTQFSNVAEYTPLIQFHEWKRYAESFQYYIITKSAPEMRNVRGNTQHKKCDFKFPVPPESISYHEHALSFNFQWDGPLQLPVPFIISICAELSTENRAVGEKRRFNDPSNTNAHKIAKTDGSPRPMESNYLRNRELFIDTVTRATNGYWSDKNGKILLLLSSEGNTKIAKLNNLRFTCHGQSFLGERKRSLPPQNWNNQSMRFKGYGVFINIRDSMTNEIVFSYQSLKKNFDKLESPFRQTVSLQLLKQPVQSSSVLTFDKESPGDSIRLIADVTMFDCYHNMFFYRSGFLWIESHSPNLYYGAMLASAGHSTSESGYLTLVFRNNDSPLKTEIHSCTITVYLGKIVNWFHDKNSSTSTPKVYVPVISKMLIDVAPREDPMDIFSSN